MNAFDEEQDKIIAETDNIKKGSLNKQKRNEMYVHVLSGHLQKHVPAGHRLVKADPKIGLPKEFSLFIVREDGFPNYAIKDIRTAIEVRGSGWYEKIDDLGDAIREKKKTYDGLQAQGIKCRYITIEERRKVKTPPSHHQLSKDILGSSYYSLRDSTTHFSNWHEWENFIHSL